MNRLIASPVKARRRALPFALVALLLMARMPARGAEPVTLSVKTGEVLDLLLSLGSDDRQDLELQALLVRGPDWPEGAEIGFPREGALATASEVPFDPNGRRLRLSVEALGSPPPGTYKASIELLGNVGGSPLASVPLEVSIVPGPGKDWKWAGAGVLALFTGLLFFFSWTSIAHSRFIRVEDLANRLEPLRWTEAGGTERVPRRASEIKGQIAGQLTFAERVRTWFAANPLVFGLPGGVYEETVNISPGNRPEKLHVHTIPRRRALRDYREQPVEMGGCLMASHTADAGLVLFAVPDPSGSVAGLRPWPRLEPGRLTELIQTQELLDSSPLTDASYQPAGWRIARRSHVL